MATYVVTSLLVALLAAISLLAFAVGMLGVMGFSCLSRCRLCGHLTLAAERPESCPYCRHPHLTHPFAARHRPHQAAGHG